MRSIYWLFPALLGFAGCGVHVDSRHDDQSASYQYRFNDNGCDTGQHTFTSKTDYCHALTDDQLNNDCAANERQQLITRDCGT